MPQANPLPRGLRNLTDQVFGTLTAERVIRVVPRKGALWLTRCSCGEMREVLAYNLRRGGVTSCVACRRAQRTAYLLAARKRAHRRVSTPRRHATEFERHWVEHLARLPAARRAEYEDLIARRRLQGVPITTRLKAEALDVVMRQAA